MAATRAAARPEAVSNAQVIASTHSPFVVGSLADRRIISLGLQGGSAQVAHVNEPQLGICYAAVLRSIFGIESELDIDTERMLHELHAARLDVIKGDSTAQAKLDQIANELTSRSEELREIVAIELRQLQRQLALRATSWRRAPGVTSRSSSRPGTRDPHP